MGEARASHAPSLPLDLVAKVLQHVSVDHGHRQLQLFLTCSLVNHTWRRAVQLTIHSVKSRLMPKKVCSPFKMVVKELQHWPNPAHRREQR